MGNTLSSIFESIFPSLAEQAKYITELESNLEALREATLKLEARSADVRIQVEVQERHGLQPLQEVTLWLSQVEAIRPQVLLVLDASAVELQRLCMYGYCSSDLRLTYLYGKEVFKKLEIVKGLLSPSQAFEVVARSGLPPNMEEAPTRATVGLENMLEATWNRLMEDEVGILGLYGMGGVGKTTLLEQINNKFLETRDEFHVVISVVVSQDLHIGRIQKEIGRRLGLDNIEWAQKPEKEKASRIKKVLTRKRFVILLDDIWRKVDLEDIGIPLPSTENRSKVVFTTRSKEVCGRMGDVVEMEVKCLDSDNAWELFQKKVRAKTLASDPKIPALARIVCGKCKGLPLALNVIGETMASKTTVREWQYAIDVLELYAAEYPEVKDEILKILKFSYDDLKDERVKQCFQYCALFPEDHEIEKEMLVDYWICEGILNERGDREKALNKGYGIIGILVNSCLLIDQELAVKMHDVVRQMALWIASVEKKENLAVQTGARLQQMPAVGDWNAVRRMSLQNNEITEISCTPDCPNLTTLFLQQNKLMNISGEFFLSMPKLVVLDLSLNEYLTKLPEEVSELVSLRYLNLSRTKLENLPAGLRKLIQLRYLNLDDVQTLSSISVISSLVNLETLMLFKSTFLSLELIEDIKLLKNLKVLSVSINDNVILERLLSVPILASCIKDILLVGITATDVSFAKATANLQSLVIDGSSISDITVHTRYGCRSPNAICFQNLTFIRISEVTGITDLTLLLFAPNLAALAVYGRSMELEEIISKGKVSRIMVEGPFQKLHTLYLSDLEELNSIYWVPLHFPSLTRIVIRKCPKLKKLPFNKESFKGNHITLDVDNEEWFEEIQWEDEAIKHRLLYSYRLDCRIKIAFYVQRAARQFIEDPDLGLAGCLEARADVGYLKQMMWQDDVASSRKAWTYLELKGRS